MLTEKRVSPLPLLCACIGLLAVLAQTGAPAADCVPVPSMGVTGFQEVVISVSDLDTAVATWRDVGEFQVHCRSTASPDLAAFWGLPEATLIEQVVLKKPVSNRGLVRLIRFHGLPQVQIRSSAMPWDTGGIFDLYMYVQDVDEVFERLRVRGWQAYNDPVNYVLGPFDIREAIMRGPDGEALVLMQRNAPPYDKKAFGVGNGFGWPFNSALLTSDFETEAQLFREQLGWKVHLEGESYSEPPGVNPTGLPTNLAQEEPRLFAAFANHDSDRGGSIQVMQMVGLTGNDFSARARAPNLGLLALRVPVPDLDAFSAAFAARDGAIERPKRRLELKPYGVVDILSIRTANGSRLDFFSLPGPGT